MTDRFPQYAAAAALERYLGDPRDPDNPFSFQQAVALDERDEHPDEMCELLYAWGLPDYYVPEAYGGLFSSYEQLLTMGKVVSRRNLSVSVSFSTMIWSEVVWLGGDEEQKRRQAAFIMESGSTPCLAYSEAEHGSDLVANAFRAEKVPGGYLLTGEKWPINRATLSGELVLLARTGAAQDARSHTLFVIEKADLDPSTYSYLPRVKVLGARGSDISGIRFDRCFVPERCRLGAEGAGLEVALKGFYITRTLCASLSLGAVDTALRSTLRFALGRRLYGRTVFALPHARRTLADAFSDVLLCDCMALAAARGLHVVPDQFSTWSAIVKYFVPVTIEEAIRNLSVVLGARFYMREQHDGGIFQKMYRDNSLVSLFDGSTVVNLHAIILRLRLLARMRRKQKTRPDEHLQARLEAIFSLDQPLPPFQPGELDLLGKGHDVVIHGLETTFDRLLTLRADPDVDPDVLEHVLTLTGALIDAVERLDAQIAGLRIESGPDQPPELFDLAKTYCVLHAAASCVHMWTYSRPLLDPFFADGKWLVFSLWRLLKPLNIEPHLEITEYAEEVALALQDRFEANQLFSIVPLQLAETSIDPVLA